jgi:murein L,D-transpeptidase YcbB/YkuD
MDLYNRILNISDEGLAIDIPYLTEYRRMMEGDSSVPLANKGDVRMELMMSAQYFHYAREAWSGLPERASTAEKWFIPRQRIDYERLLDSLLSDTDNARALIEPLPRQYSLLRAYLRKIKEIDLSGKWVEISADQRKYVEGDSGRVIAKIRTKLFLTGDIPTDNGRMQFDAPMAEGIRKFQYRHGIREDGVVGPAVLREMNKPLSLRIQQILVNMERTRWMGADPKGDHLVVNIPQFQLQVFENDTLQWTARVVVGKEISKTAIFQGKLQYVVFSPYWNVPPGILKQEILPALSRNPNYLSANNMEWSGDGVRQRPGGENALGRVKFVFPNSFNIYLHDTPSKSLFEQDKRAFSHGCIRVSEPKKLAIHLLKNDPQWTESKIDSAMNAGKERYVTLKNPIPVSIVYFTAWVDDQGKIHFRDDLYNRDQRLMDMIFSK